MPWFILAAILELVGCYAIWLWLRKQYSPAWIVIASIALLGFAAALTRVSTPYAGRAFAAYAGVYLLGALAWMWLIDRIQPDRWDIIGACLSLAGAAIILYGPRGSVPLVQ
ncbi:MAG: YnfA family protein [Gemmatimonadales bacterium]|nr:YnfA family protein [Gemmatimonadales bacterium]